MKENSSTRLKHSIQKKLMAATSMLMVAIIMMVSSTYAWFTLSTAPEVTGITTAVGANGNLEIALATADTWADATKVSSAVGSTGDNTAWGNLIDVSDDDTYGLYKIKLMPSQLHVSTGNMVVGTYLETPIYGSDGRISSLTPNTYTGTYNTQSDKFFVADKDYGVRAIGTATQMTPRQSDFRNAKASLTSAGSLTKTYASRSLYDNGSSLANVIVKHALAATSGDGSTTEVYTQADLAVVNNVIAGLTTALAQAKTALDNGVKGLVASQVAVTAGLDDTAYTSIIGSIDLTKVTPTATTDPNTNVTTYSGTLSVNSVSIPVPADLAAAIYVYNRANTNLQMAIAAAGELEQTNEYAADKMTWTQIREVLVPLVNPDYVTINDLASSDIKDNISTLVNSVLQGGIKVQLPSGSGVYSDVAELAGNYSTSITIEKLSYGSVEAENVPATMITTVAVGPYFELSATALTELGAPTSGDVDTDTEITDFYGYALDLIFRTNAAESNLLLRTDAIDRVYSDNTDNVETMGGGSTMTFESTDVNFSVDKVAALMNAIRVVFLDKEGNILTKAKLDMRETKDTAGNVTSRNYDVAGQEVTADLLLWTEATKTTTTTTETNVAEGGGQKEEITTAPVTTKETAADGTITTTVKEVTAETITTTTTVETPESYGTANTGVITALTQNEAKHITVLVYLDGNYVDNSMVANGTDSMTGTMNIQFASDATLNPMENTALREGSGEPASAESSENAPETSESSGTE